MKPEDRKLYENLQILIYALQLEGEKWPLEGILTKDEAFSEVIRLDAILNLGFNPNSPNYSFIQQKLYEILSTPEQSTGNMPSEDILADFEKAFAKRQKERIKYTYPTLNEQIRTLHKRFYEKIRQQLLEKEPKLKTNQPLLDIAADNLTDKILNNFPPTKVKATLFTSKEYEDIINKVELEINKTISHLGFPENKITPQEKQNILKQTFKEAQSLSATPRRLLSFEELSELQKIAKDRLEIPPLPKEIKDNLFREAETAQLRLNPVFVMLQPKTGFALVRKLFYTPRIASLKLALKEIKPEYQQLIAQGLLPKDLQITIDTLKEMGLKEDSPIFEYLKNQTTYLKNLEEQTPSVFENIRRYYQYEDLTGQKKVYYPPLNMELPLHRKSLWQEKGSYSYYLKTGLDRFRFISSISQRAIKFLTKGKYKTPIEFFKSGIAKRAGKWFLKTAVGKSLKSGFKKIGAKIAIKLGIKAGVAVVGAATGPPGWIVAAVTLIADKIIALAKKGIFLIQKIIRDPEKAFMAVAAGALALVIIPMPFALIGVIPLAFGVIGLASFIAAPAAIGAISSRVGTFFTSITTLPIALAVGSFVIILFAVLAGLTMFIVMVVSGAFILPQTIGTTETKLISPYFSEYFELKKTASVIILNNEDLPTSVTYKVSLKAKKGTLKRPTLTETINVGQEGTPPTITPHNFNDIPSEIDVSGWEEEYTINIDKRFEDSAIINTVKLSTSIEGVEGAEGSHEGIASAAVIIGKPPGNCPPFPWPTTGKISQGPEGATSHAKRYAEAIDIANSIIGTPVYATHNGTAFAKKQTNLYGNLIGAGYYVEIHGNCNGLGYQTEYFHLLERDRVNGPVTRGQIIGYMDSSGYVTGSHLHYEFRPKRPNEPFKMEPPNIPAALPYRECDSTTQCDITIN